MLGEGLVHGGLGLAADIWGDTDFDSYGVHPRARWPMSEYIFNQIVPQLSLGSGLASSDPVTFKPKFITQKNWMIQAQYFWMHHNGTGFAECGTLINVTAGDVIETEIAYHLWTAQWSGWEDSAADTISSPSYSSFLHLSASPLYTRCERS